MPEWNRNEAPPGRKGVRFQVSGFFYDQPKGLDRFFDSRGNLDASDGHCLPGVFGPLCKAPCALCELTIEKGSIGGPPGVVEKDAEWQEVECCPP